MNSKRNLHLPALYSRFFLPTINTVNLMKNLLIVQSDLKVFNKFHLLYKKQPIDCDSVKKRLFEKKKTLFKLIEIVQINKNYLKILIIMPLDEQ